MSTIVISNIKATGETASRAVSGVAAAWVNMNGTGTIAIRDSANVSSLTDNSVGRYSVNVSNSFSAVEYTGSGFGASDTTSTGYYEAIFFPQNTGSHFLYGHWQGTFADIAYIGSQAFGDLA